MPSYVCVDVALEDSFLKATELAITATSWPMLVGSRAHEAHKAGIRTILVAYEAEIRTILYNNQANVALHRLELGVSK